MKEAWLITGGAGFIGSNFIRYILPKTSVQFIVLDALTYAGDLKRLDGLLDNSSRVKFVKGSIEDSHLINDLFAQYHFSKVVHFAAESHVDRSIAAPEKFLTTNIMGTYTLLEAARQYWQPGNNDNRFLHISTDEVFGSLEVDDEPFNESTAYHPNSPYAASKAASDHLVRAWHTTYQLPVIITNCCNNYGPWQFPEKLIPLMITNALQNKPLPIYGDGLQIRDWIHVEDHCSAILKILQEGRNGETYAISAQDELTNIEIVKLICNCVDALLKRKQDTTQQLIQYVTDRLGHDRRYAICNQKLCDELKWQPKHKLRMALPEVVAWYHQHLI